MNAYLKRENKTCLPPSELHKTTKQKKKQDRDATSSVSHGWRQNLFSEFLLLASEGTGKHRVQRGGRSPPSRAFIYLSNQTVRHAVEKTRGGKKREWAKSWIIKNIRARYQWSRTAAAAVLWLSTNTRWIQAGQKPGGSKRTSVRQLRIFFSSRSRRRTGKVFVCGMNLWFMSPSTSDSLLPAPALKNHKPLCLPWAGPLVPIHVDRQGAWRAHQPPQCTAVPETDSAGSRTAHLLYQSAGENFRYEDVALTVESNQWSCCPPPPQFPSLPHPVSICGHPFLVLNIFPE